MVQGGKPEVRQIADPVALLVEGDGLPDCGEFGILLDREQEPQPESGLPHAAGTDEQEVLARSTGLLLANDAEQFLERLLARDERRLELVRGKLGWVVKAQAHHGSIPLP